MSKEYREVDSFIDFTGREVRVGDEIVYPSRVSSSMWLNTARVEKVEVHEWVAKSWKRVDGERKLVDVPRQSWRITAKNPKNTQSSKLEAIDRIVKVRSNKEIELAEREAELRAMPARVVIPGAQVDLDEVKAKGRVNLITFGEAAYE